MEKIFTIQKTDFWFHCTESQNPLNEKYTWHCHFLYEAYLFLDGDINFTVDSQTYSMRPYTFILVPPTIFHIFKPLTDKPYKRCVLHFSEKLLPPALLDGVTKTPVMLQLDENHKIVRFFNNLTDYARDCSTEETNIVASYYATELALMLKHYTRRLPSEVSKKSLPLAARIDAYINDHINEEINLNKIAEQLYINKYHISHVFKEAYNVSVMELVRQKKLEHAQMLIHSGIKPQKASEMAGFKNYTTFYRLYKARYNCAPSKT